MKGQKKAAYVSIALDIANKILNGEFREKQKISGRSTLASMYNVSPETIRRAIVLLEDMDVVNSSRGSGIDVISKSAAEKFIEKNKSSRYISSIKDEIRDLMQQKRKSMSKYKRALTLFLTILKDLKVIRHIHL